ncbi:MAG: hypothetical protein QXP36_07685 [Conexivisphaerales archaeon]
MARKKIIITIDEKLYEKLKNQSKHFGDISHTIEDALEFYFSYQSTHIHRPYLYKSKTFTIYTEILEYLKNKWMLDYPNVNTVPLVLIKKGIQELYGTDNRTIKKYLSIIKPYIKITENQVILS